MVVEPTGLKLSQTATWKGSERRDESHPAPGEPDPEQRVAMAKDSTPQKAPREQVKTSNRIPLRRVPVGGRVGL